MDSADILFEAREGAGTLLNVERPRLSVAETCSSNAPHCEGLSFFRLGAMSDKQKAGM